jgi:hypothetical protein
MRDSVLPRLDERRLEAAEWKAPPRSTDSTRLSCK